MKKTIFTYGIIAGLIAPSLFIGRMLLGKGDQPEVKHGMLYGYTLMILAFSFIFVATKIIRDKYNGGVLSFGRAFLVGLYITLIASTIYVGTWLINYYCFIPDFAEKYAASSIANLKASGASSAEIAQQTASMASFARMYKNPVFIILLTYVEIVPVGLVVSLLSALILKKRKI